MGILSRRNKLGKLTTVIIQRDGDGWDYSWVLSQRHKDLPGGYLDSLELVLAAVVEEFCDFTAPLEIPEDACLQYALYPWRNGAEQIFDIRGRDGAYQAVEIKGSGLGVAAPTIEGLISAIEEKAGPAIDEAMLRWERSVPLSS